ncbi:MAG: hypothetical protein JXQ82_04220 [Methanomicrobiaceae archaeon]|nr:hypothetical protein [Methanomicrobiaceae archaeon]
MKVRGFLSKVNTKLDFTGYFFLPIILILIAFNYIIINNNLLFGDYKDIISVFEPNIFLNSNPFALWNNLWLTGIPDISNFMSGRFYPFSFVFYLLSNDIYIVNIVVLLHLIIAYFAMHKLGSLICKDKEILLVVSLLYVFSGLMLSRVFAGHTLYILALAWIPLIYYFFAKILYLNEKTVVNYIAVIILSCFLIAMGNPYHLVYVYLLAAIFVLYQIVSAKKISYASVIIIPTIFTSLLMGIMTFSFPKFSENILRIDLIDPLSGGGSLENNLASFIFGTTIDVNPAFWLPESSVLIGVVCLLFAIIGLVLGKKEFTIPGIIALSFTLIWADGGNNLLWFIHYLPFLDELRCPGRIFGALVPVILFFAIYGIKLLYQLPKGWEKLNLSKEQKFNLKFLIGSLIAIKLLELPYQVIPDFTSVIALLIVISFIGLIYFEKLSYDSLKYYLTGALVINFLILLYLNLEMVLSIFPVFLVITLITLIWMISINRKNLNLNSKNQYLVILLISFLVVSMTTLTYISPANKTIEMNPNLETSPANEIAAKIIDMGSDNSQIWAYTTGWEYYHQDFNYILMKNNIHTARGHYPYVLKSSLPPAINIGNITYYTVDYLIDTAYLDNGEQNLEEYSFKVENISVYKAGNVLPNAFVVRRDVIIPSEVKKFTPDEVVIEGNFIKGDVAVLKTAYYDGWKVNGKPAISAGNMVAIELDSSVNAVTFVFDPQDVKIGIYLSILGIILLIIAFIKRKEIEKYL